MEIRVTIGNLVQTIGLGALRTIPDGGEVKPLSIECEKLAPYLTCIWPLNSGLSRVARCTASSRVAICHFFAVKSQTMLASLGIKAEKAIPYKEVLAPKIKSILQ